MGFILQFFVNSVLRLRIQDPVTRDKHGSAWHPCSPVQDSGERLLVDGLNAGGLAGTELHGPQLGLTQSRRPGHHLDNKCYIKGTVLQEYSLAGAELHGPQLGLTQSRRAGHHLDNKCYIKGTVLQEYSLAGAELHRPQLGLPKTWWTGHHLDNKCYIKGTRIFDV